MTMFWIVLGVVVAVLLVVGWLYDRRFGFHADRLPSSDRRSEMDAEARNTQDRGSFGGGF
jgi:hypothetical protein